jgi:hypothetical protein
MLRYSLAFITVVTALAAASPAEAKNWRYKSRHPHHHGGFCHNDRPHFHEYAPADARLYRVVGGEYYFVGDPVAFGYDGPRYTYYGAHPVTEANVHFGEPVHCYLEGPHYHWYAPPPQASFALRAGAFWFMGTFDNSFYARRPNYVVINDAYRPIRYGRPTVVVADAPSGWRGGWQGGPPRHHTQVVVAPPAPAPVVVRERVHVENRHPGKGHGHAHGNKHGWKDHDRGHGNGHRGRGHDKGHHKGKWKDRD